MNELKLEIFMVAANGVVALAVWSVRAKISDLKEFLVSRVDSIERRFEAHENSERLHPVTVRK